MILDTAVTMLLSWLFICFLLFESNRADDNVFLDIPQGALVGLELKSYYQNLTYYSFRSIPYAKPCVGPDKYNPPESPEPWEGVYNATMYREPCMFENIVFDIIEGTEDCLYLSVYTPSLNTSANLSVMLWVQGGGFQFGSANNDLYGPEFLMEHDVVVVTFNYRLGPVGFLSTEDEVLPGNLGMKDQTFALRWVRDNIRYFGGSSDKVTLWGASSGAAAVQLHMLSPMSKGLFRSVIQQSGSASDAWVLVYNARQLAFDLGSSLGIHTNNSRELIDKMKMIPSEKIVKAATKNFAPKNGIPRPFIPYVPTVEPDIEGQERFLTDNPTNLIMSGAHADIPILTGVNLDESTLFMSSVINFSKILMGNETDFRLDLVVRANLNVSDRGEREKIRKEIYKFYFGSDSLENLPFDQMINLLNDVLFFTQYHFSTKILSTYMKSPIYKYFLSFRTTEALLRPIFQMKDEYKIAHNDEVGFLWFSELFGSLLDAGPSEEKIGKMMLKMWTNFAKFGDPTFEMDDIVNVKWKPMDEKNNNIMNINVHPKMQTIFYPQRMAFWTKMYKHILGKFADIM